MKNPTYEDPYLCRNTYLCRGFQWSLHIYDHLAIVDMKSQMIGNIKREMIVDMKNLMIVDMQSQMIVDMKSQMIVDMKTRSRSVIICPTCVDRHVLSYVLHALSDRFAACRTYDNTRRSLTPSVSTHVGHIIIPTCVVDMRKTKQDIVCHGHGP